MPRDFADLLFPGIIWVTPDVKLFVSHTESTGRPILFASSRAFLSSQGSTIMISSASVKFSRFVLVMIPEGYFFVKDLMPVASENFCTAFHPASLLQTTIMSSGANLQTYPQPSLTLSSSRAVLKTASPSALLL